MIGLTNEEIFRLYRESNEADFQVFLEKYIEWVLTLEQPDCEARNEHDN